MFSLDVGSLGSYNAAATAATSTPAPVDYGMVSQTFTGPGVSYSTNLTSYKSPKLTILGCQPSTNNGGCVKGGETAVGIALPSNLYAASSSR